MADQRFVKGAYTWSAGKAKVFKRERCVVMISKGGEKIGYICHHPATKKLVYCSTVASTKELLEFIMPYMERKRFYFCVKVDRMLKKSNDEDKIFE